MKDDDDAEERSLREVCPVPRTGRHNSEPEYDGDEVTMLWNALFARYVQSRGLDGMTVNQNTMEINSILNESVTS